MTAHATHVLVDGRCTQCGVSSAWPLAGSPCPMRNDVRVGVVGRARHRAQLQRRRAARSAERRAARG